MEQNNSNNNPKNNRKTRSPEAVMTDEVSSAPLQFAKGVTVGSDDLAMYRPLVVRTTIRDRFAGVSSVERIWADKPNAHVLRVSLEAETVRNKLREFFLSRKLRTLINNLIPTARVKVGQRLITADRVFSELSQLVDGDIALLRPLAEIVMPAFHELKLLADSRVYTTHMYFPMKPATTHELAQSVMVEELAAVISGTVARLGVASGEEYGKDALAMRFAEAFVTVGLKLVELHELGTVIDDIVFGVRAHIDPEMTGVVGHVSVSWSQNVVVAELATCFPFIVDALVLPRGSNISPRNESSKLQEWAPIILAALKTNDRYAIMSAPAYLQEIGKQTCTTLQGLPVSAVIHRSARVTAAAQAVIAQADAFIPSAASVHQSRSKIDAAIAAAYGDVQTFSTDYAAGKLIEAMQHLVDNGYIPSRALKFVDLGENENLGINAVEFAMMTAKSVEFDFSVLSDRLGMLETSPTDADGPVASRSGPTTFEVVRELASHMYFVVPTTFATTPRHFSGRIVGSEFLTSSIEEAIIMMPNITAKAPVPPRPQLINPKAFDTTLIGLDVGEISVEASTRLRFDAHIGPVHAHGRLPLNTIGSLTCPDYVRIIKPVFNTSVFNAVLDVYDSIRWLEQDYAKQVNRVVDELNPRVLDHSKHSRANMIIDLARAVSPSFRVMIGDAIQRSVVRSVTPTEAELLAGQMAQQHFSAFTDVVALAYFLEAQGIGVDVVNAALAEDEVLTHILMCASQNVHNIF